ncbi:SDR family NAD(P)-dependent oxidoreductase [candidate division KSB1 bacterium]|nr:SDR family NAD(P)-dependent oxidoreductase [candidate division KSB1 bacterium]
MKGKTALVTGASSGIGKETVQLLLNAGATVYGAARRVEKMKDLEQKGAQAIKLDVTDNESVKSVVDSILEKEGSIDILINNAGYGSYGAIEDIPIEEARRQFDVNIFGLAHLTQRVLPAMRENRYGKIVNISSMGGKIYTPFGGWYHATKHALEGLSDCLRIETEPFGIDVVIIEPGGIATDWGIISADNLRKTSGNGAYAELANKTADNLAERYSSDKLSPPDVVARTILKAVTASRPKTRYATGYMAGFTIFMRQLLSDRIFDKLILKSMS